MLNKEKQRPERLHDNKENRKKWVEELVPFIRHEDSAAKDSVTEPPRKKNNDARSCLYARVAT